MALLPKKYPGPVAGPMTPFFIAGVVVAFGINAGANAMLQTDEWKNDPRNPRAVAPKPADKH